MTQLPFGGDWTQDKLDRVRRYLAAYTIIMSKQPFRFWYIDAFAGTGYQTLKQEENPETPLLPELLGEEPKQFLDGSASIALQIEPPFHRYVFVEKDPSRFAELQQLKTDFPQRAEKSFLSTLTQTSI